MLSKDYRSFTRRGDKLIPDFIEVYDPVVKEDLHFLCEFFTDAIGSNLFNVEQEMQSHAVFKSKRPAALTKLILDHVEQEAVSEGKAEDRHHVIKIAQEIRVASEDRATKTYQEFCNEITQAVGKDFEAVSKSLYSDLPENRMIKGWGIDLNPDALVGLYNLSQVQSLLCLAHEVQIEIFDLDFSRLRPLFRKMKFFSIIPEIASQTSQSLCLKLSCPLEKLVPTQNYSYRIACIFPYLLSMGNDGVQINLTAKIKWASKDCTYSWQSEKSKLAVSYKELAPQYRPEELALISKIKLADGWEIRENEEIVPLQQYGFAFPDYVLLNTKQERKIFIELFHKWHSTPLKSRREGLKKTGLKDYWLGVESELEKKADSPPATGSNEFLFKGLPSKKNLQNITQVVPS